MLITYLILISGFIFSQENNDVQTVNEEFVEDNLFEELLTESKLFYAEATISDLQGDSLKALYYFDNLFQALAQLEELSKDVPDIAKIELIIAITR